MYSEGIDTPCMIHQRLYTLHRPQIPDLIGYKKRRRKRREEKKKRGTLTLPCSSPLKRYESIDCKPKISLEASRVFTH